MTTDEPRNHAEDVRTEYQAVAQYMNNLVTFRFTALGFYLAAIGFIAGKDTNASAAALLIGITVAVWIIDLRNRALIASVSGRGVQIEREEWGLRGTRTYDGFFSRMVKTIPTDDPHAPKRPGVDTVEVLGLTFPIKIPGIKRRVGVVSYTLALNLLYLSVVAFAIWTVVATA